MTTLRKWRFPILIGSGLIAAGALVYFSNGHVSTEKTQGAIGQRDVYRDGQVNSADVATPGSAPVANEAILQSSEFKALAKNPAFQEIMRSDLFNEVGHRKAMADLFANSAFVAAAQDARFEALLRTDTFQAALRTHADLYQALRDKAEFKAMDSAGMRQMLKNESFTMLARQQAFQNLLASSALKQSLKLEAFASMADRPEFQRAFANGSLSQATAQLRDNLRDQATKK